MALIYITGIPGAGKTSVARELKKRGYEAYDADDDGFNRFYDRTTGERIEHEGKDVHTKEWDKKYEWKTSIKKVEALARQAKGKDIFLAGVSANEKEFWGLLDKVICLAISEETFRHRITTRENNDYGKQDHQFKDLLGWHGMYVKQYKKYGAVIVNANGSISDVVSRIIATVL